MSKRKMRPHIGMKIAREIWEGQNRRCGLCSTPEANNQPLEDVRHLLHVDHIWSIKCLDMLGISDPDVVNSRPNLWIIGKKLNLSKSHHSLRGWAKLMGKKKKYLRWCQDFSINQLRHIVEMQRAKDPSWKVDIWRFPDELHFRKNDWYESLISDRAEDEAKAERLANMSEDEFNKMMNGYKDAVFTKYDQWYGSDEHIRDMLNPIL